MIYQNLQLAAALDADGAARVTAALRAIAGVSEVGASEGAARVSVAFEDGQTSPQEIATVLTRSGFPLRDKPTPAGGCCGGCGGH